MTPEELALKDKRTKEHAKEYRDKVKAFNQPALDRQKEKIKVPQVTTGYQEKVVIANEEAIRKLFTRIIELPDEESIVEMQDFFINHRWGSRDESEKMSGIINVLPRLLYKDLATSYINQDEPFYLFWAKYKSKPNVLRVMAENKDEIESLFFQLKNQEVLYLFIHPKVGEIRLKFANLGRQRLR